MASGREIQDIQKRDPALDFDTESHKGQTECNIVTNNGKLQFTSAKDHGRNQSFWRRRFLFN